MTYNQSLTLFIKKNNININDFINYFVSSLKDINKIVYNYGMFCNSEIRMVSIANVVGKSRGETKNILSELDFLFDENGNNYQKRSVSMLEYGFDNIIKGLENSFINEPIELKEISKEKYVIGNNGMHRTNLLKLHYLNQLSKCKTNEMINDLKDKFQIKANVERLDIEKTYSKFLINMFNKDIYIEDEINQNGRKTGRVVVYKENNQSMIWTNEQLIKYLKDNCASYLIENSCNFCKDEYFNEFINKYNLKKEVK